MYSWIVSRVTNLNDATTVPLSGVNPRKPEKCNTYPPTKIQLVSSTGTQATVYSGITEVKKCPKLVAKVLKLGIAKNQALLSISMIQTLHCV
jgi:hypothetical protein